MNRIDRIFADLRQRHAKALMPFLTAGDPEVQTTMDLLPALERAGASVCEIGFPFSDPIADGPVIQASMSYALEHQARPGRILAALAASKAPRRMGLVAMVSYSIAFRMGLNQFVNQAQAARIDGLIFPDLLLEESEPIRKMASEAGLTCSLLIAPTTPPQRAAQIARACTGFIYLLAREGITGESTSLPTDLAHRIEQLRQATDLPVAVGFGVSSARHVRQVVAAADAAIVGSAIMRRIAALRKAPRSELVAQVEAFVRELAGGLEN